MALTLAGAVAGSAFAQQRLFGDASMKESLVGDLETAFAKKHPEIKLDYQSAGAGKPMAKIAAKHERRGAVQRLRLERTLLSEPRGDGQRPAVRVP